MTWAWSRGSPTTCWSCTPAAPSSTAASARFYEPRHPYTWGLLSCVARTDKPEDRLQTIGGNPPSLIDVPLGCPFHPRCAYRALAAPRCETVFPGDAQGVGRHRWACHLSDRQRAEVRP